MKKIFLTLLCTIAIFIILTSPELVTDGVRQGIKLNLYSVIPSLLPFMVLTNIMMKYNLCEYISYIFKPFFTKIFKVSSMGCFAIVIGFTCGYPMGAKIIGDLYKNKLISKSEAGYLITFCNNCSITFLLNYIVFNCLGAGIPLYMVLLLVYAPPILTGIVNQFLLKPDITNNSYVNYTPDNTNPIFSAVKSISILSVYIICFTVISGWVASISFLPQILKCAISGLTEITSGSHFITSTISNVFIKNLSILACTVFGGFCIMFQSFEQLPDFSLKKNYIIGKLEQLAIYFVIFAIFYYFFQNI